MCDKTGWLISRKNIHVKKMPITLEQYLRDQLSKDRKKDMLVGIIRQFNNQTQHDSDLLLTKAIWETHATYMKDNTNISVIQIDRAADNKLNGYLMDPPRKEDSKQTQSR